MKFFIRVGITTTLLAIILSSCSQSKSHDDYIDALNAFDEALNNKNASEVISFFTSDAVINITHCNKPQKTQSATDFGKTLKKVLPQTSIYTVNRDISKSELNGDTFTINSSVSEHVVLKDRDYDKITDSTEIIFLISDGNSIKIKKIEAVVVCE